MATDYTSEANGVHATGSELMNSTPKMATMAITKTDFVAGVTATEEDSVVEADSKTNIDMPESATAGFTEMMPTK